MCSAVQCSYLMYVCIHMRVQKQNGTHDTNNARLCTSGFIRVYSLCVCVCVFIRPLFAIVNEQKKEKNIYSFFPCVCCAIFFFSLSFVILRTIITNNTHLCYIFLFLRYEKTFSFFFSCISFFFFLSPSVYVSFFAVCVNI